MKTALALLLLSGSLLAQVPLSHWESPESKLEKLDRAAAYTPNIICSQTILRPVIEELPEEAYKRAKERAESRTELARELSLSGLRRGRKNTIQHSLSLTPHSRAYYMWLWEYEYLQEVEYLERSGRHDEAERERKLWEFTKHLLPYLTIDGPVLEDFDEVYEDVARPLGPP
jgi:hypothetical protein